MISKFETILNNLKVLDMILASQVDLYVIGGAVLIYHELKSATKDIDIVVAKKEEFVALNEALKKSGYQAQISGKEYERMELNQIYVKGDMRIDVFCNAVCGRFFLSEKMKMRSLQIEALDKLSINLCSIEDIFLFKTMTDREGDIEDCMSISRSAPDWNHIVDELILQADETGHDVWITWVAERLETMREKGVVIPQAFMDKVYVLVNKYYDKLEQSLKEKK